MTNLTDAIQRITVTYDIEPGATADPALIIQELAINGIDHQEVELWASSGLKIDRELADAYHRVLDATNNEITMALNTPVTFTFEIPQNDLAPWNPRYGITNVDEECTFLRVQYQLDVTTRELPNTVEFTVTGTIGAVAEVERQY